MNKLARADLSAGRLLSVMYEPRTDEIKLVNVLDDALQAMIDSTLDKSMIGLERDANAGRLNRMQVKMLRLMASRGYMKAQKILEKLNGSERSGNSRAASRCTAHCLWMRALRVEAALHLCISAQSIHNERIPASRTSLRWYVRNAATKIRIRPHSARDAPLHFPSVSRRLRRGCGAGRSPQETRSFLLLPSFS